MYLDIRKYGKKIILATLLKYFGNGSMKFMHRNNIRNVTSKSSTFHKEIANTYLLENIGDFMLRTFNTYRLGEDEEVEIEECDINPPSECATSVVEVVD